MTVEREPVESATEAAKLASDLEEHFSTIGYLASAVRIAGQAPDGMETTREDALIGLARAIERTIEDAKVDRRASGDGSATKNGSPLSHKRRAPLRRGFSFVQECGQLPPQIHDS